MILCWAAKGGSGTTVIACAMALGVPRGQAATLVDLSGDSATALGLDEPAGPGIMDWLASPTAGAAELARLSVTIRDQVRLIPRGGSSAPPGEWSRLVAGLAGLATVIIDGGTGCPPAALHEAAEHSLLVTRPCFI